MRKYLCLFLAAAVMFPISANADTVKLKNGNSISGIVKNEDAESVELEIDIGTVKFGKKEVLSVERTTPADEAGRLREQWEKKQQAQREEHRIRVRDGKKAGETVKEEKAKIDGKTGHIIVSAVINGQVPASLIVDTGASIVVLTKKVADKLAAAGISPKKGQVKQVDLTLGDGRKVKADFVILDSVRIENSSAENIEAAIMPDDQNPGYDGVLGMSFLSRFNFGFKQREGKLTLEKLR